VATTRPAGAACAAVIAEFERSVSLDVAGLPGGSYVVVANGVSAPLTLAPSIAAAPTAAPTLPPTPEPTQEPAALQPTPEPTPIPTLEPTPVTANAPAADSNCINKAAFDRDVTIPDETVLNPGDRFVKTWRVQNAGTCVWQGYQLVFDNGARMDAALSHPMPVVQPGAYVELSVNMAAPAAGGSHIGRWLFQSASGKRFGLSVPTEGLLWVWINVPWTGGATAGGAPAGGAPVATGGSCGATRNGAGEGQILGLINNARAANGLGALNVNGPLSEAAWRHAQDMACNGINSLNPHRGSDGTLFKDRVFQAGYGGSARNSRENVYYGGSAADAFDWWMNSQVHRDNILFATLTDIGVAYAVRAGSEWTNYYTLVFGQP
jgi:uncharacterized protein YkwD